MLEVWINLAIIFASLLVLFGIMVTVVLIIDFFNEFVIKGFKKDKEK